MQIVLAIIGAFIGAILDEWRGALFAGVLGFVLGELWSLRQRVADLSKTIRELQSRTISASTQTPAAPRESRPAEKREESSGRSEVVVPQPQRQAIPPAPPRSTPAQSTAVEEF